MSEKVTLFHKGASDEVVGAEVERGSDPREAGAGGSVARVWAIDDSVGAGPRTGCGSIDGGRAYQGRWRAKPSGQAVNSKTKASKAQGFARARKVANEEIAGKPEISSETVRLEVAGVVMCWPLSRGVELARWLQSLKAAGA